MAIEPKDFWIDRPTLVTGATGLLGSWLVRHLVDSGADVVCLVRDFVPQSELHRSSVSRLVKTVHGDLVDQALLERVLGEYEIDTVFHLAAQTIVGVANRNPVSTFETNIRGTWALLEAARRSPGVRGIVVASSDKAYGSHESLPYTEAMPLQGSHPYDVSKSCADLLTQSYAATYDLPAVITRCGNLYGGGDLNWSRIIPGTIRSLLRARRPIIRSNGKMIRDYFYVEDAAASYMLLAQRLAEKPELKGEAFNFANEEKLTVLEVAEKIIEIVGSELTPDILDQATNEIPVQYLSADKARRMLSWSPQYSIGESLKRTIAWYERFFERSSASRTDALEALAVQEG